MASSENLQITSMLCAHLDRLKTFGAFVLDLWAMNFGLTEVILILVVVAVLMVPVVALGLGIRWYMNKQGNSKQCPYCAEKINLAAMVCRFCQRQVA